MLATSRRAHDGRGRSGASGTSPPPMNVDKNRLMEPLLGGATREGGALADGRPARSLASRARTVKGCPTPPFPPSSFSPRFLLRPTTSTASSSNVSRSSCLFLHLLSCFCIFFSKDSATTPSYVDSSVFHPSEDCQPARLQDDNIHKTNRGQHPLSTARQSKASPYQSTVHWIPIPRIAFVCLPFR